MYFFALIFLYVLSINGVFVPSWIWVAGWLVTIVGELAGLAKLLPAPTKRRSWDL